MEGLRAATRYAALALVVFATGVAVALPRTDTSPTAGEERPTLVDDDGGKPMFTVPALAPGHAFTRCIKLTYRGGGARVRLTGGAGGNGLADRLLLTIERGSGGGYDSCAGFRGSVVYDGTVGGLATANGFLAQEAKSGDQSTYRFTVTAASDLEQDGRTATAAFTWEATETAGTTPPTPTPDDPASDSPASDSPGGADPAAAAPPASPPAAAPDDGMKPGPAVKPSDGRPQSDRDARPGAADRAKPRPDRAPGGGEGGPSRAGEDRGGFTETLREAIRKLAAAASEGAKRGAFPLVLLLLMATFLLAQHRFDSRDPKLALAPVHAEPELPFADYDSAPITAEYGPSP